MKLDPIIGVADVQVSSQWYQSVFGFTSSHGGEEFEVLTSHVGDVILCLHKWNEHDHPTMRAPDSTIGNGLILYFRAKNIEEIFVKVKSVGSALESEIQLNPNSKKKEFSLRDLDGYYITVSEFH